MKKRALRETAFFFEFKAAERAIHKIAKSKGWHDTPLDFPAFIANLHGEVSEAWEAYRKHNPDSEHLKGFSAIEEELADCIIRIMDVAHENKLDIAHAILAKMKFNKTRPFRHGGKKA